METLQPKLRFPGFDGDWKIQTLGSVSSKPKYGLNSSAKEYDGINGYIRITDIDEISRKFLRNKITSPDEFDDSYLLESNDLLFTRTGASTGKTYLYDVIDGRLFFAGFLIKFNVNEANSKFVFYQTLLSKYDKWVKVMSMRSGQPGINAEEYSVLPIALPKIEEQTRIANFLSSVDEKLNLLKEKKALLEDYKKGIMQKIFNQEIRFKDDNGNDFEEWEESILSEVVNLFHGYQFRTSDFTTNGIAVIKISNVIGNNLDLNNLTFIKEERFEDFKSFEIKNDDILMSLTGNIGRIIEVKEKPFTLLQNYRVGKFIPLNENIINKPFLKYLLASDLVFGRFSQLANQSAQANFGKQDMDKIKISYPVIKEQTKIANFLSAIDEKIALVGVQIEETQEYKKGLLQQMFV